MSYNYYEYEVNEIDAAWEELNASINAQITEEENYWTNEFMKGNVTGKPSDKIPF